MAVRARHSDHGEGGTAPHLALGAGVNDWRNVVTAPTVTGCWPATGAALRARSTWSSNAGI